MSSYLMKNNNINRTEGNTTNSTYQQSVTAYQRMQQQKQAALVAPYVEQMVKKIELRKNGTIWYTPNERPEWVNNVLVKPKTIYVCNEDKAGNPDFASPAVNVSLLKAGLDKKRQLGSTASATEIDEATYSPFYPEWIDDAVGYHELMMKGKTAGAITSQDFTAIQQIILTGALIQEDERQFTLQNAVTNQATANMTVVVDTYHRFTIGEDYREMDEVDSRQGSFTRASFRLGKAVGHVAFQDDFFMDVHYHDVQAITLANMNSDMTRVKVKKIGAQLLTADSVAGGDWSLYTGEHSTTDPYVNFNAVARAIEGNFGTLNTVASNMRTYQFFLANTHTRPRDTQQPSDITANPKVIGAPAGLNGVTWYIDNSLPDTKVLAYDKAAIWMLQGPTKSAQYRDEHHQVTGYYTRDYHKPVIVNAGKVRQLTGVTPVFT